MTCLAKTRRGDSSIVRVVPRRPSTHVDDPRAVGRRVREARERVGLKQRGLVFDGLTAGYLSRIEAGQRVPSLQVLAGLAERLGVTAEYLAIGAEPGVDELLEAELQARTGDRAGARRRYQRARHRDPQIRARADVGLGRLALEAGDHEEGVKRFEAALASDALAAADHAFAREQLGRAYAMLARFDESLAVFQDLLAATKAVGDIPGVIRASVLLANTHIDRGEPGRAEEVLAEVIDDARASAEPVALSNLFWSQARLHASQRRPDLAAHYAQLAHASLAATEHTVFAARALLLLAQMENDRGDATKALDLAREAEGPIAAAGNRYDHGLILLEKARSLARLGEREEAASIALGATPMFAGSHATSAGRAYAIAAGVFRDLGDDEKALELYELAAETLPTADRHLAEIYRHMATVHERLGNTHESLRYLNRALDVQGVGLSAAN
jgi:tetratricopeptide (TPR) repeat protein